MKFKPGEVNFHREEYMALSSLMALLLNLTGTCDFSPAILDESAKFRKLGLLT